MKEKNSNPAAATGENQPQTSSQAGYFSDLDFDRLEVKIEEMFKGGVHFGHHKSRKNPKMNEYIFTTKNNINIFDLEKTAAKVKAAMDFLTAVSAEGKEVLLVGTKKQAKKIVEEAAKKAEAPFVTERWLGGTFSNFSIISGRAKYLREGQEKMQRGEFSKYTKFEQMKKAEELERLERKMGGIKNMTSLPGAVFVASIIDDKLAVKEARALNLPIVALVDSNVNPEGIEYPIPANEDAVSSIRLLLSYVTKAILDGKKKRAAAPLPEKKQPEKTPEKKEN